MDVPIGHVCLWDVQRELPQVKAMETALIRVISAVCPFASVLCLVWAWWGIHTANRCFCGQFDYSPSPQPGNSFQNIH